MGIFDRFKREQRSSIERYDDVENTKPSGGFALNYNTPIASNRVTTISAVYGAVEIISNSIAQCPIHIRDNHGNIIYHTLQEVFKHNLLSKFTLIKQLVSDMLLYGNGIAYIERDTRTKEPIGLIYLPKGKYTIVYNDATGALYYQIPTITAKAVLPQDVIHILKNSLDGVQGKGFYYYANRTIDVTQATEDSVKSYFDSGCSVNAILKAKEGRLSAKAREDILTAWNTAHSNYRGNNIAVMPVDLDFIPLSHNSAEAQMLESRLFNLQEVCRFFNISPVMLGDLSHSSYTTIEAAQLEFLIHTIAPLVELIQDEFNRKLTSGQDVIIDIDSDHIIRADKSSTSQYLKTLCESGILSINEARHQLGLEPIEGGDKHTIAYTKIEDNTIDSKNKSENEQ